MSRDIFKKSSFIHTIYKVHSDNLPSSQDSARMLSNLHLCLMGAGLPVEQRDSFNMVVLFFPQVYKIEEELKFCFNTLIPLQLSIFHLKRKKTFPL